MRQSRVSLASASTENVFNLTGILVAHGWLEPLETHRRDRHLWRASGAGPDILEEPLQGRPLAIA